MSNSLPINQQPNTRPSLVCAFYLCLTVVVVWFWTTNLTLSNYNLHLTCIIVLLYFVLRSFIAKKPAGHPDQLALEATIMTAVILLIITISGGLNSSLFFLIYFLLFATALIFDVITTLILTLAIALFFSGSLTSSRAAIQLSSLLFFSPLAIYFGKLYFSLLYAKYQAKQLTKTNHIMSNNITKEENLILPWLTLDFRNTMIKVIHLTSEMLTEIGTIKPRQAEKLKEILEESKKLMVTGEKLKEEIDIETD